VSEGDKRSKEAEQCTNEVGKGKRCGVSDCDRERRYSLVKERLSAAGEKPKAESRKQKEALIPEGRKHVPLSIGASSKDWSEGDEE
jgi:hypothetical protein